MACSRVTPASTSTEAGISSFSKTVCAMEHICLGLTAAGVVLLLMTFAAALALL
jgi:hypothetical protein